MGEAMPARVGYHRQDATTGRRPAGALHPRRRRQAAAEGRSARSRRDAGADQRRLGHALHALADRAPRPPPLGELAMRSLLMLTLAACGSSGGTTPRPTIDAPPPGDAA